MNPIILADNRFKEGVLTAASEESSEFSVENLADSRPYTYWKSSVNATNILLSLSVAGSCNTVGIVGHNFGTVSASIFFEKEVGGAYTAFLSLYPDSDKAILVTFAEVTAMSGVRVWVYGTDKPQMSYLALGIRIDMPQPVDSPTVPYVKSVVSEAPISKTGQPLGTTLRYRGISINHKFSLLERSWVTSTFESFWDDYLSQNIPFFYGWDLTLYPTLAFYCWRNPDATFSWPTSMLAYVDSINLELQAVQE